MRSDQYDDDPNPFTMAMGDTEEMRKAIQLLDEVKESINQCVPDQDGPQSG